MGACDSQPQETTKSESKAQNELKNKNESQSYSHFIHEKYEEHT